MYVQFFPHNSKGFAFSIFTSFQISIQKVSFVSANFHSKQFKMPSVSCVNVKHTEMFVRVWVLKQPLSTSQFIHIAVTKFPYSFGKLMSQNNCIALTKAFLGICIRNFEIHAANYMHMCVCMRVWHHV